MSGYPPDAAAALQAELDATKRQLVDAETHFAKLKTISRKALEEFNRVKDDLARESAARSDVEDRLAAVHDDLVKEATRRKHLEQLLQATAAGASSAHSSAAATAAASPQGSPQIATRSLFANGNGPAGSGTGADASAAYAEIDRLRRELRAEGNRRHDADTAHAAAQKALANEVAERKRLASELALASATAERLRAQMREDQEYIERLEEMLENIKDDLRATRRERDDLEADLVAARDELAAISATSPSMRPHHGLASPVATPASTPPVRPPRPARPARPAEDSDDDEGGLRADDDAKRSPAAKRMAEDSAAGPNDSVVANAVDDDLDDRSIVTSIVTALTESLDRPGPLETDPAAPPVPQLPDTLRSAATRGSGSAASSVKDLESVPEEDEDEENASGEPTAATSTDEIFIQRKRNLLREVEELEALRARLQRDVASLEATPRNTASPAPSGSSSTTIVPATAAPAVVAAAAEGDRTAATPPPLPTKDLPLLPPTAAAGAQDGLSPVSAAPSNGAANFSASTIIHAEDVPREASLHRETVSAATVLVRPPRTASYPLDTSNSAAAASGGSNPGTPSEEIPPVPALPAAAAAAADRAPTPGLDSVKSPTLGASKSLDGLTRAERRALITLEPILVPPPRSGPSILANSPNAAAALRPADEPMSPTPGIGSPRRADGGMGGSLSAPTSPRVVNPHQEALEAARAAGPSPGPVVVRGSPAVKASPAAPSPVPSLREIGAAGASPAAVMGSSAHGPGGITLGLVGAGYRRPSYDITPLSSPSREHTFTFPAPKRPKKPSKFNLGLAGVTSAFAKIKDKMTAEDDSAYGSGGSSGYASSAGTASMPPTPGYGPGGRKMSAKPPGTGTGPSPNASPAGQLHSGGQFPSPSPPPAGSLDDDAASIRSVALGSSNAMTSGDKSHIFQATTFNKIVKCHQCGDRIWGMGGAREMSCRCCGLVAHTKCAPMVPPRCPGAIEAHITDGKGFKAKAGKHGAGSAGAGAAAAAAAAGAAGANAGGPPVKVFGVDLAQTMAGDPHGVPAVVARCVAAVEAIGMDFEGVYRKSGPLNLVKQAVADFDRGHLPNLADEDVYGDVTVATSVLKQYLRDLPNPLITFGVYPLVKEAMRATASDHGGDEAADDAELAARQAAMRRAVAQLPPAHAATLHVLFAHLRRVADNHALTRMTPHNLGVVFGPTLMRDPARGEAYFDMGSIDVVEFLLEHHTALFGSASAAAAQQQPPLPPPAHHQHHASDDGTGIALPRLHLPSLGLPSDALMDFSSLLYMDGRTPTGEDPSSSAASAALAPPGVKSSSASMPPRSARGSDASFDVLAAYGTPSINNGGGGTGNPDADAAARARLMRAPTA
ncbi:Rho-type gtpase-activating protein [Blastocladiella emersonii ATCC 22665]|nr:Rho-type gtpase-activating protein [Blastocladiella emersonii ATCC 22665]